MDTNMDSTQELELLRKQRSRLVGTCRALIMCIESESFKKSEMMISEVIKSARQTIDWADPLPPAPEVQEEG